MITNAEEPNKSEISRSEELKQYVSSKINRIQSALLGSNPGQTAKAKSVLAKLRKAPISGEPVYSEAWQIVLGETGLGGVKIATDELFPERLQSKDDSLSNFELATYVSLVCYAIHQQSQSEPMHQTGKQFAASVGELVTKTSPSTKSRFDSLTSAQTPRTINLHLKTLISLLKAQSICFDYGQLSVDLSRLYSPAYRNASLMKFSREFVSGYLKKSATKAQQETY